MAKNEAFFAHFPKTIRRTIQNYIRDQVLIGSRYLFTRREGKRQFAYCTHCNLEHESKGLKHGSRDRCPNCKSLVFVKASGRGRKALIDTAYLLWYEKSKANPKTAIIARGFYLKRDYSGDYRNVETTIKPIALYLFEWGKGGQMMHRDYYWPNAKWNFRKSISSEAVHSMSYVPCYWAKQSARKAVKGTPFQYCTWENYDHYDRVKVFDLCARYKCIEFLTKIGLGPIVTSKLTGQATYGSINWNGQTPEKVLRLAKSEIKEMRKAGGIGARTLRHYQLSKKEGSNLSWDESRELSDLIESDAAKTLNGFVSYAPIPSIKRYLMKQMKRNKNRTYGSGRIVLFDWRDYLNECRELGMDLNQAHVLFPNDLYVAHQKTTSKVKLKRDEKLNQTIIERAKDLQKYAMEQDGLILRPVHTLDELFQEGKKLQHCVGGYAARYANGSTNIFVIRKANAPKKPFYTLEWFNKDIRQCRGYKNCDMTPKVKAFVEAFIAENLEKKSARIKVAARQEVAV